MSSFEETMEYINSLPNIAEKVGVEPGPIWSEYYTDDGTVITNAKQLCEQYDWDLTDFAEFLSKYKDNDFVVSWDDSDLIINGKFDDSKSLYYAINDYGQFVDKPYINPVC